tara:strand:- start:1308 stop:1466 length:159 start_codon:yes stop_codon:yes gene_type:complete
MEEPKKCAMCGENLTLTAPESIENRWFCSLSCANQWRATYQTSIHKQIIKGL